MTPAVLQKVVYSGARSGSFAQAESDLKTLAECQISSQRIRRWTERIGNERVEQTAHTKEAYKQTQLPARRRCPVGVQVPEVACVEMDGGRLQIRERCSKQSASAERQSPDCSTQLGYWRESKVGCLLRMTSITHDKDPRPKLPTTFSDKAGMNKMCSEIKGFSTSEDPSSVCTQADTRDVTEPVVESNSPQLVSRNVVASRKSSQEFGLQLAAAAYAHGFNAAERRAFVCDGQTANWKVWEQWFSHYTPIVDFIHAVCYVYAAAMAGRPPTEGWQLYLRWAQWLWSGEVAKILRELEEQQLHLGKPSADESTTSPRYTVGRALTYLQNQRSRMDYPSYRRQGLPITSSHIESTIKQVNKRVKGSEKFWDRCAEAILHLTADYISSSDDLNLFWAERPKSIASTRTRRSTQQVT